MKESWAEMWSSSEGTEADESEGLSDDSLALCPRMEAVHAGAPGQCFLLPEDLCDSPGLLNQILSMDTWNSLPQQQKQHLMNFLPTFPGDDDVEEKERSLKMLFSGEEMRFNNPLKEFQKDLRAGYYRPDIARMRTLLNKTKYKDYKRREKWRMFNLVKSVLVSRCRLADAVTSGEKSYDGNSVMGKTGESGAAADRQARSQEARARARYAQELMLIRQKLGDSDDSSQDEINSTPVYSQMLKKNRRKELEGSGSCVLGTLSPGPNPWDISKYPSANPYRPNQLSYSQLLKTHYNRKTHKKYHPGLHTEDMTLEEVAQRCKLIKRPPPNPRNQLTKKLKVKTEETEGVEEWSGGVGAPTSGTGECSPMDSTLLQLPEPADEEADRLVDIEAVDDSPVESRYSTPGMLASSPGVAQTVNPSITAAPGSLFNSLVGWSKVNNRGVVGQSSRKVKSESPVESSGSRKLSLESMLDEPVPVQGMPTRRPRAESTDSHLRNLHQRHTKEIPPLPKKPDHKRSHSLTESKPVSMASPSRPQPLTSSNSKLPGVDASKSGKSQSGEISVSHKSTKPSDLMEGRSVGCVKPQATPGTPEDVLALSPVYKKIKSEPAEEMQSSPLPSFKKLKSELPDKNSQPLPSFKKLKSGEITEDLLSSPGFKKLKSGETVEELLPLPSFKKLKSGELVEDFLSSSTFKKSKSGDGAEELLPLPSFKKLKSETAEYHARAKLAKGGAGITAQSTTVQSGGALSPATQNSSSALGVCASSVPPMPPLKVEPLDPPPQVLPSFNIVQPAIKTSSRIMTPATLSDLDGIDMMALPVDFDTETSLDDLKGKVELKEETQACFFSLIRDVVTSTEDHRMDLVELEARLKAWASSPIAPLNHWYSPDIEKQLLSALFFLTGESQEIVPEDYVPYMEYKVSCNAYQWIGAGRDSDHRLVPLCSVWAERAHATPTQPRPALLIHRPIGFRVDGAGVKEVVLARPGRSGEVSSSGSGEVTHSRGPAVQASSPRDRHIFRIQEKQRYECPQRSFTYRVGNCEGVLGPVRTTNSLPASKARGHTLLVPTRPKSVSILELVRDAVARLPGGQGTRADIVTLLKDSQYLLEDSADSVLSSVVSGALDKLHSEDDPSVRFDTKRKIWVYQHSHRSPEEFERLHALNLENKPQKPKPSRKSSKKKETTAAAVTTLAKETPVDSVASQSGPPGVQVKSGGSASPASICSTTEKQTKSLVKVISSSQASSPAHVRSLPKQSIGAQQMLQLKQQLMAEGKKVLSTQQSLSHQHHSPQPQQQQVIVMKGGDQQQMIVISGGGSQQQFVVEQGVLSAKQHKQIQQLLTKQHDHHQHEGVGGGAGSPPAAPTSSQHRQSSAIVLQQQLQQLILAKQQQMLSEQGKSAGQQSKTSGASSGQQMILVKQGSTESENSGPSQGKASAQQMILVKGSTDDQVNSGKVSSTTQQMILVKGEGEGVGSSKVGSSTGQQMILVKGSGDSEQTAQTLQQMILVKGASTQVGGSSGNAGPSSSADLILVKQQGQVSSSDQSTHPGQSTSSQQIILKQQQTTSSQGQQTDLQQISQQHLQQILLKQQQQQSEVSSQLQQLLMKQLEGPAQQLQHLLVKQPSSSSQSESVQHQLQHLLLKQGNQSDSIQQISQQQLHQILVKQQQQQNAVTSSAEMQQIVIKQSGQVSSTSQAEGLSSQHQQGSVTQQQLQQLLAKQGQSQQGETQSPLQQLVMKQSSAVNDSQHLQQLLVKQSQSQQGETQSPLQQLMMKQASGSCDTQQVQLLVKQGQSQQGDSQSQLQQLVMKQSSGPGDTQQVQLLVKQNQNQQGDGQSQLQQLVMKQGSGAGDTQQVQLLVKQNQSQQGDGQSQLQQLVMKQGSGGGETQQVQLLVKQNQSQQGDGQSQLQQLVMKQGSGGGETQQVQLLVKQQGGQTDVQHISQQQLQQILLKQQQQQMIIVKQHDQKHIQVIPQNKAQSLTLAQIQQIQQQQKSTSATTSLLTSPRVVTSCIQSGSSVGRTSLGQYAVVSVPQQRVSVSSSGSESSIKQSVAGSSGTSPRLPISVAQLSGKQLLLTGKPTTQNVLLGTTSSGQTVLLHQGSQQILIPSQTLKALHGLKVIPITGTSVSSAHRASSHGLRGQGQQVFARLVAPSARPVQVVQQPQPQAQPDLGQQNQQQSND